MKSSLLMSMLITLLVSSVSLAQQSTSSSAGSKGKITENGSSNRMTAPQEKEMVVGEEKPKADMAEDVAAEEAAEEAAGPHKVGDKASDFELQSIGKTIQLSDNFADGGKPVIVVFSRANW